MKILYKLTCKLGDIYIIASHPTEAQEKATEKLDRLNYGFRSDREILTISKIAEERNYFNDNDMLIT